MRFINWIKQQSILAVDDFKQYAKMRYSISTDREFVSKKCKIKQLGIKNKVIGIEEAYLKRYQMNQCKEK